MSRRARIFQFVAFLSVWPGLGHAITPGTAAPGLCNLAADAAERGHRLPAGLLAAIGLVESGRADPTGHVAPWPWTIDAAGAGAFLPSAAAAVAAVRTLHEQGERNIDVGCFQVNLGQHPDAFASLEAAFDPQTNADYAASFLSALRLRTGSWGEAVAAYHSADPALGIPYRDQVFAQWAGATPDAPDPRPGGPTVIAGVRIWTPGAPGTAPKMIRMDQPPPVPPASGLTP
jgi:hypothetical protein